MLALESLRQLEFGTADDHRVAVREVVLENFLERHHLGNQPACMRIRNKRQHDHAERGLHRGVLVEPIQHDSRNRVALELDHDPHSVLVRLVAQIGYAFELLVAHELGDIGHELRLVDLVRQLVDHDLGLVGRLLLFDHRASAHHDSSASGVLVILDPRSAVDVPAGWEVGTLDDFSKRGRINLRIIYERNGSLDYLADVVRRNVGSHADSDSGGAVDQKVRNRRGEDCRLLKPVVEIRREVDGVLVDVGQHLHRDSSEPRFGVPVRSC